MDLMVRVWWNEREEVGILTAVSNRYTGPFDPPDMRPCKTTRNVEVRL